MEGLFGIFIAEGFGLHFPQQCSEAVLGGQRAAALQPVAAQCLSCQVEKLKGPLIL